MPHRPVSAARLQMISLTIASAAGVLGSVAIDYIMRDLGAEVLVVGACTAALSYAMARVVVGAAKTPKVAVLLCLGLTVVAAVLNSPLSFVAVGLVDHGAFEGVGLFEGVLASLVVGAFITVPLGLCFAVPNMVLIGVTHRASRDPSREASEQTLRACGVWLTIVGGGAAASSAGLYSTLDPGQGVATALTLASLALCVVGAFAGLLAHVLVQRRRRWLGRVRAGLVPGWSLVPADELLACLGHLRPLISSELPPKSVLVRRSEGPGPGAYRRGERLDPVALV
jgi:hypothetical protein